jgi:hypothetical protein
MRFTKLLWITRQPCEHGLVLYLISATRLQEPRVVARISSRITTGIRVVTTFTETITVVMSHSQFHYV